MTRTPPARSRRELLFQGASFVSYAVAGGPKVLQAFGRSPSAGRRIVTAKEFGAVGDGIADDTAAIAAAISQADDFTTILLPRGTYLITGPIQRTGGSGIWIKGEGATLKARGLFSGILNLTAVTDITVEGLIFDQGLRDLPLYTDRAKGRFYNCGIRADGVSGLSVSGCAFVELYTAGILLERCSGRLHINDNTFSSPVQSQDQNLQHIHLQTIMGAVVIDRNVFTNERPQSSGKCACAIFASGIRGSISITRNRMSYCGRDNSGKHRLAAIDFYGDVQNVSVVGNSASNCLGQFMRLSSCHVGLVAENHVSMSPMAELDYSMMTVESVVTFSPGAVGCRDVTIRNNEFTDRAGRAAFAVGIISYDWGAPALRISVNDNTFTGARKSVFVQGPFYDVKIERNTVSRGGPGQIMVRAGVDLTSLFGTERRSVHDRIFIRSNIIRDVSGLDAELININLGTLPSGGSGFFLISDNQLESDVLNDGYGIAVQVQSRTSSKTRIVIRNNVIRNSGTAFYPRTDGSVSIEGNLVENFKNAIIADQEQIWVVERMNTFRGRQSKAKRPAS